VREFPSRFADDEFHVLGLIQHREMRTQQLAEGVEREVGLAAAADTAQPVLLFRNLL
jgi:ABC-type proline/glycine betaine transport system ATPase subunit